MGAGGGTVWKCGGQSDAGTGSSLSTSSLLLPLTVPPIFVTHLSLRAGTLDPFETTVPNLVAVRHIYIGSPPPSTALHPEDNSSFVY
jgi:hypothetical protein